MKRDAFDVLLCCIILFFVLFVRGRVVRARVLLTVVRSFVRSFVARPSRGWLNVLRRVVLDSSRRSSLDRDLLQVLLIRLVDRVRLLRDFHGQHAVLQRDVELPRVRD